MNIFILSKDPIESAQMLCDQHVVKMPLETAQILCTAYTEHEAPYKRTHYNHPCCIWSRKSRSNYEWLIVHGLALCDEYNFRYKKIHASEKIILWCWGYMEKLKFEFKRPTPFELVMDEIYKKNDNPVESYRNFYILDKSRFASWRNLRNPPTWYYK